MFKTKEGSPNRQTGQRRQKKKNRLSLTHIHTHTHVRKANRIMGPRHKHTAT